MSILQALSLLAFIALAAAQCPAHFTSLGSDACYKMSAKPLPWVQAEQECNSYSSCSSNDIGHLASVHSITENEMLLMLYDTLSVQVKGPFWVGLNDRARDGTFLWSDGWLFSYKNFPGQSPAFNTAENCVAIQGLDGLQRGLWDDYSCTRNFPYVCIIPSKPAVECPPPINPAGGPRRV